MSLLPITPPLPPFAFHDNKAYYRAGAAVIINGRSETSVNAAIEKITAATADDAIPEVGKDGEHLWLWRSLPLSLKQCEALPHFRVSNHTPAVGRLARPALRSLGQGRW